MPVSNDFASSKIGLKKYKWVLPIRAQHYSIKPAFGIIEIGLRMGILFYSLSTLYYTSGATHIRNLLELRGENEKNEETNLG
ncbi:predicted protein [Listeria monocytogenes FSL J2-071]|nr:predicted protein [Listeria monocytogenes FSL J2-071]CUM35077.1 Predicted protein [Listeria monocytogenes]